jgi:hypothetical protein
MRFGLIWNAEYSVEYAKCWVTGADMKECKTVCIVIILVLSDICGV